MTKSVEPLTARSGDTVTYTLTLINDGLDAAPSVVVQDVLPVGVTYVSHDPVADATYTAATRSLAWTVDTLAANTTTTLTITVTVD